jgi:DUF971 family protein
VAREAASVDERFEPADIDVQRDASVTVTYRDGATARFYIEALRLGCPCATCRGLRDQGTVVWPRPGAPRPLRIEAAALHGAWGLAITWNDGHATGIFPFDALRRWHDGGQPFAPDSGLGGSSS